jgi:branched-chain amino acid transport system ATP-binding protein
MSATLSAEVLAARGISAGYGQRAVIEDLTLEVPRGRIVALLGANGAGKTTTVLTLAGELKPMAGAVEWLGSSQYTPLFRRARQGLGFIGEERSLLMGLTIAENMRVARADTAMGYELFPELERLHGKRAGLLSGGEQQMLALACALGRKPAYLLADELSLGLAPLVVDRLLAALRQAAETLNLGVLLVEQHVTKALRASDHAYLLRRGKMVMEGTSAEMLARSKELQQMYLEA